MANGRYQLEMRLSRYNNPTRTCQDCPRGTCCDDFGRNGNCDSDRECDVYFIYCLRPLGSTGMDCFNYRNITASEVRRDTTFINFNQDSTVLGLPNPLRLPGLTEAYTVSVL